MRRLKIRITLEPTAEQLARQRAIKIEEGKIDTRLFPSVTNLLETLEDGEELTDWEKGYLWGKRAAEVAERGKE